MFDVIDNDGNLIDSFESFHEANLCAAIFKAHVTELMDIAGFQKLAATYTWRITLGMIRTDQYDHVVCPLAAVANTWRSQYRSEPYTSVDFREAGLSLGLTLDDILIITHIADGRTFLGVTIHDTEL